MFKVKNDIALGILEELFVSEISRYDFRNDNSFRRMRVNSVWDGTDSVSYIGLEILDWVTTEIKISGSFNAFKFKIKKLVPKGCTDIKNWFSVR